MLKSLRVIVDCAKHAFKAVDKIRPAEWIRRHVVIPDTVGAVEPGPMDLDRTPPLAGLLDMLMQSHVRELTLVASARVGKTLLTIALMLYKIAINPGPILWLDPSRSSARNLFRREIEPYLKACKPVWALAIKDRVHWNASICYFKGGSFLKMAGAGSPNEISGFNAEIAIVNESDKVRSSYKGEAPPREQAKARQKQYRFTSKLIESTTPQEEMTSVTWPRFLAGSQHHAYLPCPHCKTMQRLTFWAEEKEVPFKEFKFGKEPEMLPAGEKRIEKTGELDFSCCRITERREKSPGKYETIEIGWDYDKAVQGTTYKCCKGCKIEFRELNWMLRRYRWMAHNGKAARRHLSAHYWAAYSPFESWGEIAQKFLLAKGNPALMMDFYTLTLGLPFKSQSTEVQEGDIQKVVNASPEYYMRSLPFRPELLTISCDVHSFTGANPLWFTTWAWAIDWSKPGWPTIAALVDYGPAVSWEMLEELSAIRPAPKANPTDPDRYTEYPWKNPDTGEIEMFRVGAGIIDSGDQAQSEANVYEFCVRNSHMFTPSKGGSYEHTRGNITRLSPVYDGRLTLLWYWSNFFAQTLYRRIIKDRSIKRMLPRDLGEDFFRHLCDEYTKQDKNGKLVWDRRTGENHLGDCWKMQEVLSGQIEAAFDQLRAKRAEEDEERLTKTKSS